MKLTIFFNGQFWVGVVESELEGELRAACHVFGPEPQDGEVLAFVLARLPRLLDQTQAGVPVKASVPRPTNPKRLAREAARETARPGVSTKAQQALQAELEQRKELRRESSRADREAEEERRWQRRRAKAKAHKRGH